jgi:hypothetical protein
MSVFKSKPTKVKVTNERGTLDEIHRETIEKFNDGRKIYDENKQKIYLLKEKLKTIDLTDENYDKINSIKNKIKNLENDNKNIDVLNDELNYFVKNSDILLNYYKDDSKIDDIDEISDSEDNNLILNNDSDDFLDKLNSFDNDTHTHKEVKQIKQKRRKNKEEEIQCKSILSFLSNSKNSIDNSDINFDTVDGQINCNELQPSIVVEKGTLKNQYLMLNDPIFSCKKTKLSPIKTCQTCNTEKTLIQSEGIYVCQKCGKFEYVIIESEIPSHKDSMNEKPKYPYKTINHLIERLNQFQGKQTTIIPKDIYTLIDVELKKMLIDREEINPTIIKKILKKYRLNIYYEHCYLIFSTVTDTPPPSLTRDEEEKIKNMFKATEKPFKKYKPENRSNCLNYSYTLHKLFLILADFGKQNGNLDVYNRMINNAKYFGLLKSRDKLKMQDLIWRKICIDLSWPYHPSF